MSVKWLGLAHRKYKIMTHSFDKNKKAREESTKCVHSIASMMLFIRFPWLEAFVCAVPVQLGQAMDT